MRITPPFRYVVVTVAAVTVTLILVLAELWLLQQNQNFALKIGASIAPLFCTVTSFRTLRNRILARETLRQAPKAKEIGIF